MMTIAYIISSLANSGPIIVVQDLAKMMVKHGHRVTVFYFDDKKELEFPCPTVRITLFSDFNIKDFDLVHCHGFRPDLFVALHKPLFCNTPVCTTIHSYMFSDHVFKYGKILGNITARLVLASTLRDDKIILLSKNMQDYYSSYLSSKKLTYAYNSRSCDERIGLTNEEKKQVLEFKGNAPLICTVSGLNPRKGLAQIIKSLPLLPKFKYCVVGNGNELEALQNLASQLGVSDRVLFVGSKSAGYRYLKYADLFAMPSYSEGFPLAMLEAASMGKAVVCSDIPIFKEIFSDEEIVRFRLEDVSSLSQAILKCLEIKEKLGMNIKLKYEKKYSLESFYNRHICIYNDMIRQKNGKIK